MGHAIGCAAGWLSLVIFGLTDAGSALAAGVTGPRVLAAALSLGLPPTDLKLVTAAFVFLTILLPRMRGKIQHAKL